MSAILLVGLTHALADHYLPTSRAVLTHLPRSNNPRMRYTPTHAPLRPALTPLAVLRGSVTMVQPPLPPPVPSAEPASAPIQTPAPPVVPTDRLMEVVTGGSGTYAVMFSVVLIVALHAILAFGTLSGVLLDAAILQETGIPKDQVVLGNSLVFFGWIPGAILGGPLGDRFGRKPAAIAFSALASLGMCAVGLVPDGAGTALLGARALTGVGLGGFIAPSFALLVESSDPRRTGRASVTWTWGYVGGVVLLCALHYGLSIGGAGWRAEELVFGAWGLAFAAATQVFVVESPRYLLASGDTSGGLACPARLPACPPARLSACLRACVRACVRACPPACVPCAHTLCINSARLHVLAAPSRACAGALDAAGAIARWNGVDLDGALASDPALAAFRTATDTCVRVHESTPCPPIRLCGPVAL